MIVIILNILFFATFLKIVILAIKGKLPDAANPSDAQNGFWAKTTNFLNSKSGETITVCAIIAIGAALRLIALAGTPAGFNQDEASIAYDAWSIATYGLDRNGYIYPVYPVAWGTGHGPLYMYLVVPFVRVFGMSEFIYRLPNALLGVGSTIVFYFLMRNMRVKPGKILAIATTAFFAIVPWHIQMSRWGLDSNPLPFFMLLGVLFLLLAARKQKTVYYVAAAASFALTLYCYLTSLIVLPVFLVFIIIYFMKHKKLSARQLLISGAVMAVVLIPLGLFVLVNFFGIGEIITPYFSVPKLTYIRSNSVFTSIFSPEILLNPLLLLNALFFGVLEYILNSFPGFHGLYYFALPIIILGLTLSFRRASKFKNFNAIDTVFCVWFAAAVLLGLFMESNVNRMSIAFIPLIYFTGCGFEFIAKTAPKAIPKTIPVIAACFIIAASIFSVKYFSENGRSKDEIGYSFKDAVIYANAMPSGTVYVTEDYNMPYMLVAYYLRIPPKEFASYPYDGQNEGFRSKSVLGKFHFVLPPDINGTDAGTVFVFRNTEIAALGIEAELFDIKTFEVFSVFCKTL